MAMSHHSDVFTGAQLESDGTVEEFLPIEAVEEDEFLARQEEEETEWLQQFEYLLDHAASVKSA